MSEFKAPSYGDERFVESLMDSVYFRELLDLAEGVCLRKSPVYERSGRIQNPEAKVVQALGIRGLRSALEISMGLDVYPQHYYDVLDSSEADKARSMHPMKRPDYINGPLDRELMRRVEVFGDAIIDEAYEVLGSDADRYVALFRDAKDDDTQLEAMEWLEQRLRTLSGSKRGVEPRTPMVDDEIEAELYHPVRLSPKAIGRYPNHRLPPTCLGLATVAAGFLKRAGADFMHFGVLESERLAEMRMTVDFMRYVQKNEVAERFGTTIPDTLIQRMEAKCQDITAAYHEDLGTHSGLMVRLTSGTWLQMDPNYRMTTTLPQWHDKDGNVEDEFNDGVTEIYDTLQEFKELAPGLELSRDFEIQIYPILMETFINDTNLDIKEYRDTITSYIETSDGESFVEPFRKLVVEDIFKGGLLPAGHRDTLTARSVLDKTFFSAYETGTTKGRRELTIDKAFYEAFEKFVLWDMPLDEWRQRIQKDEAFKQRAVEDVMRLPLMTAILYSIEMIDRKRDPNMHGSMEFGLPETRIGMSVLNNFSIYFDDRLSVHHWVSQWSSSLALVDRIPHSKRSRAQHSVLTNGLLEYSMSSLKYPNHDGRIAKFFAAPAPENQDADEDTERSDADGTQT